MELSKDDVILAQQELIARQERRIGVLTKQVDELIDSVNWYEEATRHNEMFEHQRDEIEGLRAEVKLLKEQTSVGERSPS